MYASSLMRRVCLYFGNDFSTAYFPFSVYNMDSGGDQRLSAFDLDLAARKLLRNRLWFKRPRHPISGPAEWPDGEPRSDGQ